VSPSSINRSMVIVGLPSKAAFVISASEAALP
jgi:hypothetical protein